MSTTINPAFTRRDVDGLAVTGRTLYDLRGIRFEEGEGGNQPAPAAPAEAATPPAAGAAAEPAAGTPGKVEDLPDWAQKIIHDTRQEAATHRTAKTAAEQQQQGILAAIAKAAGIEVPGEKPDPEKLANDLTAAQQNARTASIKLAVYQAAGTHQGNPDALLDSNTFLAKVQALDPTAADFGSQVGDAIKAAVAANPTLKTARAAGASTVDTPGGTGEQGQLTAAQIKTMTPQQIVEAKAKGLLRDYLAS